MFAITRSLIRSPSLRQGIEKMQLVRSSSINIKVVPAAEKKDILPDEHPFERNVRLGREMSPHITIYKPQLTSILSLTHRGTGIVLSAYAYTLGISALLISHDISHYVTIIQGLHLNAALLGVIKFVLSFPFTYHYVNGMRHLLWDYGKFLKMKEVYSTGYVTLGVSVVLSIILAML